MLVCRWWLRGFRGREGGGHGARVTEMLMSAGTVDCWYGWMSVRSKNGITDHGETQGDLSDETVLKILGNSYLDFVHDISFRACGCHQRMSSRWS